MVIKVRFVKFGEHAKVKVVNSEESADMDVISVVNGEDIRVKRVESGETFKVRLTSNTGLKNHTKKTLISYSMGRDGISDLSEIRAYQLLGGRST